MFRKITPQNIVQLLAMGLLLLLPLMFLYDKGTLTLFIIFRYLIFCVIFGGIYMLHYLWLFPKFYVQKRYTVYSLALIVLLFCIIGFRPFDMLINRPPLHMQQVNREMPPPPPMPDHEPKPKNGRPLIDVVSVLLFFMVIALAIIKATDKQLALTTQRALQAETEKAQAELSFLKAQVNPHFLFNILNNIYTLAITKADNTGPSIMKLSNMMRYLTDEAGDDLVNLQKEIDCITDYIDLQRLRLTQKTLIHFEVAGNTDEKKIAPLILMAFVENVFKYGVSNHKSSNLIIKITIQENTLHFYCENPIHHDKQVTKRNGIGLENTQKRLQYVYPDRHILVVNNDGKLFKVDLSIYL